VTRRFCFFFFTFSSFWLISWLRPPVSWMWHSGHAFEQRIANDRGGANLSVSIQG